MTCGIPEVTLSDAVIPNDVQDRTIVVDNLKWFKNVNFSKVDLERNYEFAKNMIGKSVLKNG